MDEDLKTLAELGYEFDSEAFEDMDEDYAIDDDFDYMDTRFHPAFMTANTGNFGHHSGW